MCYVILTSFELKSVYLGLMLSGKHIPEYVNH